MSERTRHVEWYIRRIVARGRTLAPETLLDLPNPSFYAVAMGTDVAVATYSGNTSDTSRDGIVFLSRGQPKAKSFASGHGPTSLASGDIDGDGHPDLAVCNQGGDSVSVLLGGHGTLREGETLPATHPQGVALGDLDGDGKADLVVATRDGVLVFFTRAR